MSKKGRRGANPEAEPPAVLNLFAYTGGSTLAAVAAGARATHVDGARTAVAWARRDAELNGFTDRPVRWIADDAVVFARRERRRGRRYAGIVLDPPSYGHGPGGHDWRLERDLPGLLADIAALLEPWRGTFVLLSAHSGDVESGRIASWLERALGPGDLTVGAARRSTRGAASSSTSARRSAGCVGAAHEPRHAAGVTAAMTAPELTSTANPRVKAVVRLRDRRERDATGLAIVDGVREIRRAMDAGVEIVEAFAAESLATSGRGARAPRAASPRPRHRDHSRSPSRSSSGSRSATGRMGSWRSSGCPGPTLADIRLPAPPDRRFVAVVEGRREARQPRRDPALGGRCRARRRHRRRPADRPGQPQRHPGAASGTIFARPVVAASTAETLAWLRASGRDDRRRPGGRRDRLRRRRTSAGRSRSSWAPRPRG